MIDTYAETEWNCHVHFIFFHELVRVRLPELIVILTRDERHLFRITACHFLSLNKKAWTHVTQPLVSKGCFDDARVSMVTSFP